VKAFDPDALLRELDFERLAGTDGEARARDILVRELRDMGLAPAIEGFEVRSFEPGTATLEIGGDRFDLVPHGLEGDRDLEGELAFLENADVLAFNRGAFRGKVVLAFSATGKAHEMASEAGVAAYVAIAAPNRPVSAASHRQKWFADGSAVPTLTIPYADAERLAPRSGERVRIAIRQGAGPRVAHNIVATLGAPRRDENLVYLTAHYDSVARSHGAVDNAGGTVAALAVARHFAEHPPDRELRLVLFSGEELGLRGSLAYVREHGAEVHDRGRLAVNLDIAGDPIGADSLIVVGTRELAGYAAGICREEGIAPRESVDVWPSDGMPFALHEVPSVNVARTDGRGSFHIHTPGDVAANVTGRGLDHPVRAARALLARVLGAEIFPLRREIDDSLREKIEKYFWNLTQEKLDLQWTERWRK
jgi:aminopeptidase YwaD